MGRKLVCHNKAVLYTKTSSFFTSRCSLAAASWREAAKPLILACRRWRGSVNYGADQVPMTCIHDCHAATLIRRTYMEFGDATGCCYRLLQCSISNPLPLGSPEAAPKRICAHYRGTVRYLATATRPSIAVVGWDRSRLGCCHTRPFRLDLKPS